MNLIQKLKWIFRKTFKDYKLSVKIKNRSVRKFNKLKRKFVRKNRREPRRRELGFLIIHASHLACRLRGKRGHWIRQKIREYLFNMNGIDFQKR
jgi:hypothetical protein